MAGIHITILKKSQIAKWRPGKKTILFIFVIILIIAIASATLLLQKNHKSKTTTQQVAKQDIPNAPQSQPIGSPNAGSAYGDTLKDQIKKATKDAEVLALEITKIPPPTTTEEKMALSKKQLELGKLYSTAMMHKEAIETLDKVAYIDVNDYSDARATMGKAAVAIGSIELAKRFYTQAIEALKPVPANLDKINEYKAAVAVLG